MFFPVNGASPEFIGLFGAGRILEARGSRTISAAWRWAAWILALCIPAAYAAPLAAIAAYAALALAYVLRRRAFEGGAPADFARAYGLSVAFFAAFTAVLLIPAFIDRAWPAAVPPFVAAAACAAFWCGARRLPLRTPEPAPEGPLHLPWARVALGAALICAALGLQAPKPETLSRALFTPGPMRTSR